ncbi:siderophore-interacting protein [Corynebacterium sp.]|uniref:siderophore-interacting protein n=1 Tax=Corynebacterium sp. TaxID=1720 RepID=UPI0025C3F3B0|nr:siderophore-interacting protein [Corynebacterium sp.]
MAGRHHRSRVVGREWVTPRILRLTVDGAGDLSATAADSTDAHVALYFYPPEAHVPERFVAEELTALHEFATPQVRRYTVHRVDPLAGTVEFDVVVHEPVGLASGRLTALDVGDELLWWGPTQSWRLPEGATTLLLFGDETALPAMDAILTGLPETVTGRVVAEVADGTDEVYLADHADRSPQVEITWVHRGSPDGTVCPEFVTAIETLATEVRDTTSGPVALWAGHEFASAAAVRRMFLRDPRSASDGTPGMTLTKQEATVTSYWIHGQAQDARPDARNRTRNLEARAARPDVAARHLSAK